MSKEKETKLISSESSVADRPIFVEVERMFEKMAETTREIAARAYNFFIERGSQFGGHIEDWLRAEAEVLRTAPVKITENGNMVNVTIAAPGFKPDEIEVTIKDDLLIVSGETSAEEEKKDETTFYSEWQSNRFLRKLLLPAPVETEGVEAKLMDGVLTLALKKKAETEASKVSVKAA